MSTDREHTQRDDPNRMRWFGSHWGAPICDDCVQQEVPVGWLCLRCHRPIEETDNGVTMLYIKEWVVGEHVTAQRVAEHYDCLQRSVLGYWPPNSPHARYCYDGQQQRVEHLLRGWGSPGPPPQRNCVRCGHWLSKAGVGEVCARCQVKERSS